MSTINHTNTLTPKECIANINGYINNLSISLPSYKTEEAMRKYIPTNNFEPSKDNIRGMLNNLTKHKLSLASIHEIIILQQNFQNMVTQLSKIGYGFTSIEGDINKLFVEIISPKS